MSVTSGGSSRARPRIPLVFRTPEWVEARAEALGLTDHTTEYIWGAVGRMVAVPPIRATTERLHQRLPLGVPVLTNPRRDRKSVV